MDIQFSDFSSRNIGEITEKIFHALQDMERTVQLADQDKYHNEILMLCQNMTLLILAAKELSEGDLNEAKTKVLVASKELSKIRFAG